VQNCRGTLKKLVSTAETHQQQRFPVQPVAQFLRELLERWQIVRPDAQFEWLRAPATTAPALRIDEALRQAIINLLDNAADTHSGPLRLTFDCDADNITLRIRDHGPGLALDIAEQLGKPFVGSKGKGLGLGLFLSHATIERCGGQISLHNHPEGGTEAILRLPIATPTPVAHD
jgi:two-component system sensor histidine kinase RegB